MVRTLITVTNGVQRKQVLIERRVKICEDFVTVWEVDRALNSSQEIYIQIKIIIESF